MNHSARIAAELDRVERECGVRVLYACESGSRAWGFESADSDFDVRFIYARPAAQYLRLRPERDVIERPIDGDLDISGWDLLKAARLAAKSNPPLLEWLASPIVYRALPDFAQPFAHIARTACSLRSCAEHYLSMARRQISAYVAAKDEVIRKKYLYAVRPVAAVMYLLDHRRFPPTEFQRTIDSLTLDPQVRRDIAHLVETKKRGRELGAGPPIDSLNRFLTEQMARLPDAVAAAESAPFPVRDMDRLILQTLGLTADELPDPLLAGPEDPS